MILRRFMQHVKEQNWFAVGLDVLVVIVGIFLGMQVTEWNDDRKQRAEEFNLLKRFESELTIQIEREQGGISWNEKRIELANLVISVLQDKQLDPKQLDDFNNGLYLLGVVNKPRLYWGVIEELRASGKIGLISSIELRQAITDLEKESEWRQELVNLEADLVAQLRVKLVDYYQIQNPDARNNPKLKLSKELALLAEDTYFNNYINRIAEHQIFAHSVMSRNIDDVKALRELVREEIKMKW